MADIILKIDSLSKSFRSHWTYRPIEAVKNVNLEIYRGECFGFLGHNGAGKTTSLKCVLGLIKKSSGRIELEGEELRTPAQRRTIGYLPEQPYFYDHLTVEETLDFFARLHDLKSGERQLRITETLAQVGLESRRKASVNTLSKGLKQRLGLAQAIINRPRLLLLDEPFSGLDPIGRLEFRELFVDLKNKGCTLILSSHILSDIEDICDRVSIMARGEVKTVFALADSATLFGESLELIVSQLETNPELTRAIEALSTNHEVEQTNSGQMHIFTFSDYLRAEEAIKNALAAGAIIHNFQSKLLSLEDIFMTITGERRPHEQQQRPLPDQPRRTSH